MIHTVHIENLQSHKNTKLVFDKGVNCIIGPTDSGKSGILRGIKWAIYNKPGGDEFKSHWGGETSVSITTTENQMITRRKGTQNLYELNDSHYTAFGREVPEDIQKVLNMDNINLQEQLDSIFLLKSTSGDVAAHFNKIAKLDKIDTTTANINKGIKRINSDIKHNNSEILSKTEELEEYSNLEVIEKELERIESKQTTLDEITTQLTDLENLIEDFVDTDNQISEKSKILPAEQLIDSVLDKIEIKNKHREEYTELRTVSVDLFKVEKEIEKGEILIKAHTQIEGILKMYESVDLNRGDLKKLDKLYKDIEANSKSQETTLKLISKLEKFYHDNFPGICPLCNK
jgi:exonuclease SbcC